MKKIICILIILLKIFFFYNYALAQENSNLEKFEVIQDEFLKLYNEKNFDEALTISTLYLELAEKVFDGLQIERAVAYYNVSALLIDASYYEKAKSNLKKSLDISKIINDFYLKNSENAKLISKEEKENLLFFYSKVTIALGLVHEKTNEFEISLDYYEQSFHILHLLNQNMAEDKKEKLNYNFFVYYNNTGNLYSMMGNYEEAEYRLNEALYMYETIFGNEHVYLVSPLNSLGLNFLRQHKPEEAENVFLRANQIIVRRIENNPDEIQNLNYHLAKNLKNLSGAYQLMADNLILKNADSKIVDEYFLKSLSYAELALEIEIDLYGERHGSLANSYTNLAYLYTMLKEVEKSLSYSNKAVELYKYVYGTEMHMDVASAYSNLGNLYTVAFNDLKKAEFFYKKALDISKNVLAADHNTLLTMYGNMASVKRDQGDIKSQIAYLEEANKVFYSRLNRNHYSVEKKTDNEMNMAYSYLTEYIHAVTKYTRLHRDEISDIQLVELVNKAFKAHQLAKESKAARALALSSSRFSASNNKIKTILKKIQNNEILRTDLEDELSDILQLSNENRDLKRVNDIRDTLQLLKTENDNGTYLLNKQFPSFVNYTAPSSLEVTKATQLVKDDHMLVSYHIGEDKLTTFIIAKGSFYLLESEISKEKLISLVKQIRKFTDPSNLFDDYNYDLAHYLFQTLFPFPDSFWEGVNHLILVPTGPLLSLPFATLVTNQDNSSYEKANWLIKKVSISYLPSISSLDFFKEKEKREFNANFVGIGDPILSNYTVDTLRGSFNQIMQLRNFSSLPETREELKKIAKSLNQSDESLYLGDRARESIVKNIDYSKKNIVMFATHGVLSGEITNIYEPALILTPPHEISDEDDGVLTASEIMGLELNADWVLLSACNTAAGDKPNAEGLSGLAKAFFYAGSKSLLVSQWYVESKSAVTLTTGIFNEIKISPEITKAKALQNSILNLIQNTNYSHPFFWAPFILVGDGI